MVCVGFFSGLLAEEMVAQVERPLAWEEAKELIDIFLKNPSKENAEIICEFLLGKGKSYKDQPEWIGKLLQYSIEGDAGEIIRYEILAGNLWAAKVAYRLIDLSDGHFTEELCRTFGRLIRINPRVFLETIKTNPDTHHIKCSVLFSPFIENELYDDNLEDMRRHEYIERIRALMTVDMPELKAIRDRCVAILQAELR